ncbi:MULTISPECIES: AraC family transcriptional regulator [Paenibacillus]|uniref:AraC family transcriptional regulator n=1 Tax=Paenibacillus TaxID=44249 RepID=UPI001F446276|nr:AraC family transcriptional regulator [Paenibacillus sp. JJ-223]CAH1211617.1 HTH-type transcriptional activator RhaR [Paenibacillus sp. JJ-223]
MPRILKIGASLQYNYRSTTAYLPVEDGFHSHPQYEVYYFHAGECTYIIGDRVYVLAPGDLVLMHGMTLHRPHPMPDTTYERTTLHFDPSVIRGSLHPDRAFEVLQPFEELGNCRLNLQGEERTEFEGLLFEFHRMLSGKGSFRQERLNIRLCDLLYFVADLCRSSLKEHRPSSEKEKHVQHILRYIDIHYMDDIGLDDLAGELHLSKPYLAGLFKEMTGSTVFKYVFDRRINQAKLLFQLDPEISVTEVSRLSGFKRLSHFSRMFKQSVGCTPDLYRTRIQGGQDMA